MSLGVVRYLNKWMFGFVERYINEYQKAILQHKRDKIVLKRLANIGKLL